MSMETKVRVIPAPNINNESQPWWDAAAKSKLLFKHCKACNKNHYYPRSLCPFCFSDQTEWKEASGKGGKFVSDGNLISGVGKLPFNTDGGGLCNNHPANRGGITKVIEAVRQLRGEAHPKVQVKNCDIALAHGTGGSLGVRHGAATLIMERA